MNRNRPRGIVSVALAALLLLTAVAATVPAGAQDEPPGDGTDIQPTPGIVTAATPEAGLQYATQEFAGGRWRIALITSRIATELPEFDLPDVERKMWIVAIVDVTNWSRGDARLDPRDFSIRIPNDPDHRGFARRSTEGAAAVLGLEPEVVADRVAIDAGETERLVLVFQVERDTASHALRIEEQALPLAPSYSGPPFDALPDIVEPPATNLQLLTDVVNGSTIEVEGEESELALGFVDAPIGNECYSLQSTARLDRMSTERILVENDGDAAFVWAELQDGTRRLLNHEQISGGYAALDRSAFGRFHAWLLDSEQQAKNQSAGLWSECTGPHGIELPQAVQQARLQVATDTGTTTPFLAWIDWRPKIVTTPDGGAWVFFNAAAEEGQYAGNQRVYAAEYDPTQGSWLPAETLDGGEIQFGASAVVDSRGNVHVVYSARESADPEDFSTLLYTYQTDDGSWADWEVVAPDALAGHQVAASLAIDRNDNLYVIWQDQRAFDAAARFASPANADIFISVREAGGDWSEVPAIVNTHYPTSAASRPDLVVDDDRLVATWSVYTSALGLASAARIEWSTAPLDDPLTGWETPRTLAAVRGDVMGGRFIDMEADPTGGVVLAYGRQGEEETFLFMKRLKPNAVDWTDDTLIAFGNKGNFPSVTVNQQGTVYFAYHVSIGSLVKIGASSVGYRSVEPGPEVILTQDDPNTQGFPSITTDVVGRPWVVFLGEIPGFDPSIVGTIRNARVPSTPLTASQAPTPTPTPAADIEDLPSTPSASDEDDADETPTPTPTSTPAG